MKPVKYHLVLGALALIALSCSGGAPSDDQSFIPEVLPLPSDPESYAPIDRFEAMQVPPDNPMTAEKAALGRQLYYDARLSGDGKLSCYSCHVCEKGLTDGRPVAIGAFEKTLTRSAPTMWNVGYHAELYWDGRAKSLEAQAFAAWKGGNMGADPDKVASELNRIQGYKSQFQSVFGEAATVDNIPRALSAYMRTIISDDTPWDRWQKGDEGAVEDGVKRGYEVFQKAECTNCHSGALFTDLQFHNVGIGMDAESPDVGRFKVTRIETDTGAFKTPTLRDITQSAPYYHNGSVATLEEAVDLMLAGGIPNPHLDKVNLKAQSISAEQRADLLAFLGSLDQPCEANRPALPQG